MNYQIFFDNLNTDMFPSAFLHYFGVNGKVSGSVGAVGEIRGNVIVLLHGPRGCAYHYRYSSRRRHKPFYSIISSNLCENEVIYGGLSKLCATAREAWIKYSPELIIIVPTPVSDILNEDILSAAKTLGAEGIAVAVVKSELFSHRDKSYAKKQAKQLAKQSITGDNRLEMELKGCGFTEALYAIVEQVMQPQEMMPLSVNIETVGWGGEGKLVLREIASFLSRCGVRVNCWLPSCTVSELKTAPRAQLNIVKRVRWARRMKEIYGTDYLHISVAGRYTGLCGIAAFYSDIAQKLGIADAMQPVIDKAVADMRKKTSAMLRELNTCSCVLICRGIQNAPFRIKLFAREFNLNIKGVCVIMTESMKRNIDLTPDVEAQFMERIQTAVSLYASGANVCVNPDDAALSRMLDGASAIVGTDFTFEGKGVPVIPAMCEMTSLSFESYERNLTRLVERMRNRTCKDMLILNRMRFDKENPMLIANTETAASREMWNRMWLYREENK